MNLKKSNIKQVIGCAYTFSSSQTARGKMAMRADHSAHGQKGAFSYFRKVDTHDDIIFEGDSLVLREHPIDPSANIFHWHEPEVALILGKTHRVVALTLGNDFSAGVEFETLPDDMDPTYFGKCWPGSCSLLSEAVPIGGIDPDNLNVSFSIKREGRIIFDKMFSTARAVRSLLNLPNMIVKNFNSRIDRVLNYNCLPESKKISLNEGFLPEGTIILTGTAIPTFIGENREFLAKEGDVATVYCDKIGRLSNLVKRQ